MMEKKDLISLIVPCYNETESLPYFYKTVVLLAKKMPECDFEFLFVNDGSTDETLKMLRLLAQRDKRVRYISFSRNFGKEGAMLAGLQHAKGDYVTIMDADLQDPPELLPKMYELIKTGDYDSVATRRKNRKGEPPIRSFFANCFYALVNHIAETEFVPSARDYRLMTRKMLNEVLRLQEKNRFTKGLFNWVGFRTKWLLYDNTERVAGQTKWSFWKLFRYAIEAIVAFSVLPLYLPFLFACLLGIISLIGLIAGAIAASQTSIIVFSIGLMITFLFIGQGVQGLYTAKSYKEIKDRPLYIITETEEDTLLTPDAHLEEEEPFSF